MVSDRRAKDSQPQTMVCNYYCDVALGLDERGNSRLSVHDSWLCMEAVKVVDAMKGLLCWNPFTGIHVLLDISNSCDTGQKLVF
ncbi:hypothetical protein Tco_1088792 [Tanacetum coccineum]